MAKRQKKQTAGGSRRFGSILYLNSLFSGFHVFICIDDHRQHLDAAYHRGSTFVADRHVCKSKVVPDPTGAVIVAAGPNHRFFVGEIFNRFSSISQDNSLL
jgi:hypothetical protein